MSSRYGIGETAQAQRLLASDMPLRRSVMTEELSLF